MIYKFKLTPVGNFFFGTERTFGEGTNTNYLAKSSYFPQQTSVLGMLRFEFLKQNGQIPITDKEKAEKLIGKDSFNSKNVRDFGQILRLSPLFVQSDSEVFYHSARHKPLISEEKKEFGELMFQNSGQVAYSFGLKDNKVGSNEITKPILENFNHKTWYKDYFQSFNSSNRLLFKDVFNEHSQIGITKKYDGEDKNQAFFKKTSYSLKKGLSFGFWLELKEPIAWQKTMVFMGAERSTFLLEIEKKDSQWYDSELSIRKTENNTIVLLSDAFLDKSIYQHQFFAMTSLVDFRNFESNLSSNFNKVLSKTNRKLNLVKKGSVLFPADFNETVKALQNEIFTKIGYNAYMTI